MVIPEWLQERINHACPYCGTELFNNDLLTDRYCPNPKCPEHMAQKVALLAKRFGVKGFGIASAREVVRIHKFVYHTQFIPYWFKEKPALFLHEIGEICMIKGHQKKWREYCEGHDSMREVIRSPRTPASVRKHGVLLICTEAYCKVKPRLLGQKVHVMMSGSFDKYRARSEFIADMNSKFGDVIQLIDVGKRKTGVDFLVKEPHATDHEKSAIALSCGIPIISPSHLEERLQAYRAYILEGGDKA